MNKDTVFLNPKYDVSSFEFNQDVADVFDDMVSRSVPYYTQLQQQIIAIASSFLKPNGIIYDFGASTGTTLYNLHKAYSQLNLQTTGIDYSLEMLEKAKEKNKNFPGEWQIHDLNTPIKLKHHDLSLMILTLQFLAPESREVLLKQIYDALLPGGAFIFVEKIEPSAMLSDLFETHYFEYKRQMGYSDIEIQRKKLALQGKLKPLSIQENQSLLLNSGFKEVSPFFQWFQFVGWIAVK